MQPHELKNPPIVRRKRDGVEFHAHKFLLNNPDFELVEPVPPVMENVAHAVIILKEPVVKRGRKPKEV